ncbi:MAG: hypothetical protein ACI9I8_000669 [Cellvibrionaceae bacterium]|jgi:hypothetical protein
MKKNTNILLFSLVHIMLFFSCQQSKEVIVYTSKMTVSGDFLFEGPNTLQGGFNADLVALAEQEEIDESQITAVYLVGIQLAVSPDSLQQTVESALVQLVSDDLSLETAGTINPFTSESSQTLSINTDLDILPYLKDASTQLIVDVNLSGDLDEVSTHITFEFSITYK